MRCIYEQQRLTKTDYFPNAKLAINMYMAHSDYVGVEKILPDEKAIVLRNQRRIGYNHIVLAMGMQENFAAIKGFEEAWKDLNHPVFAPKDHSSWRSNDHKAYRWTYNFTCGDAYFCIPPYPFRGEIETYNFFISSEVWKWYVTHGKLHPKFTFTIMNANDKFAQYIDSADQFIKDLLQKNRVRVEYGQNLVKINAKEFKATFKNFQTGEL